MDFCKLGLSVIEIEARAIQNLAQRLDQSFNHACELILNTKGRVIVLGIGKSGHIGSKIAATFASTGTPAFFVHPGEASHGDMGMITEDDVVILLSNSGTTSELVTLLPLFKRMQVPIISLLGKTNTEIAAHSTVVLNVGVDQEACPLGLAPTSSTTTALVMGDALAVALLEARGFTEEDFARSHPGGLLGRKLLLQVQNIMHHTHDVPMISPTSSLKEAIIEITSKKMGMTTVVNTDKQLQGIITDGDLRRAVEKELDFNQTTTQAVMSTQVKTISSQCLAAEALQCMNQYKITSLVIVNDKQQVHGVIHLHDLLNAGVV